MPVTLDVPEKRTTKLIKTLEIIDEVVAFCPRCMTMETLYFTQEGLLPTRKFQQVGNRIFHDCHSPKPCRLYRSS